MDSLAPQSTSEDEGWDSSGFEIPSLDPGKPSGRGKEKPGFTSSLQRVNSIGEKIYLGPHGAPPSHSRQAEVAPAGRKQRLKQKLKEAEKKSNVLGRENKVEVLRELMGTKPSLPSDTGSSEAWI